MKIPYGASNFGFIRSEGYFYVDKTPFLPVLESVGLFLVFLRPRRFGKSTLISMMEHYYDVERSSQHEALFGGLWIHDHPTPERGKYLVLTLDFSSVSTEGEVGDLQRSFAEAVRASVRTFLLRYRARVPDLANELAHLEQRERAEDIVGAVMSVVAAMNLKMYVLIDEYDHFANRLLSKGAENIYESIVTKTGFVRTFYAALKAGTRSGAIARLFATGVSPLMLDDLSSGFNIATLVSGSSRLNALAGFTREETEKALDTFLRGEPQLVDKPGLNDRASLFGVLEKHYNGYRFSDQASERIFNSDLILYFLQRTRERGEFPDNMLDVNVRTEYSHLQRIGTLSGARGDDRRALLETIVSEGHVRTELVERFGARSLSGEAAYLSLLYHLGMLTLGPSPRGPGGYDLEIPNRVIRELQWEHLALMLREEAGVSVTLEALTRTLIAMVEQANIGPFLSLFHKDVLQAISVRDMRGLDEKAIKLLVLVYASLGKVFWPLSEKELSQGYTDLFLAANRRFPTARFSWLLELKYLKTAAKPRQIEAAFAEANRQVQQYVSDPALLPLLVGDGELRCGTLVFVGAKKILFRPFGVGTPYEATLPPERARKSAGRGKSSKQGTTNTSGRTNQAKHGVQRRGSSSQREV